MTDNSADVIIVGSGPTGSTYARIIRRDWPEARILMVEAGPHLTPDTGCHMDNVAPDIRLIAQLASQGPTRAPYAPITEEEWDARRAGGFDASLLRRPGLFLANDNAEPGDTLFAGFSAAAVGGMAAYWTTGCPRPSLGERVPFIAPDEMAAALDLAEQLLKVDKDLHPGDRTAENLRARLGAVFDPGRPEDRRVQPMPLACTPTANGFLRHGIDVVLGPLLSEPEDSFRILAETACRRIVHENGRVTGVELARPGERDGWHVAAGTVIVAADSLHSPQLLHASGIRPAALGRYINDHYQVTQLVEADMDEPMQSMTWIPRIDDDWPFSVTVASASLSSLPFPAAIDGNPVFAGVFCASDLDPENRVVFDDSRPDWLGLPTISIHAAPTPADRDRIEKGKALVTRIANIIGRPAPGFAPAVLPVGSSLHYQGTMRMGAEDDGTSVCDRHGRVWGFENLHVAGNGVIPTVTATNPTLYSVALATIGARQVAAERRRPYH